MPKKINIDIDKLAVDKFIRGLTTNELTAKYNCSKAFIFKQLKDIDRSKYTNFDMDKFIDKLPIQLSEKLSMLLNTLDNNSMETATLNAKTSLLEKLISNIRLLQGKSTANISTKLLQGVDKDTMELIQNVIQQSTKDMLRDSQQVAVQQRLSTKTGS
jgi:hypothetical protein